MNYGKQSHFAKDCKKQRLDAVTNWLRGTKMPQNTKKIKGIKGCVLKHFAFYYNNRCPVYKETKYGISYQPQEPELEKLKGIEEEDRI